MDDDRVTRLYELAKEWGFLKSLHRKVGRTKAGGVTVPLVRLTFPHLDHWKPLTLIEPFRDDMTERFGEGAEVKVLDWLKDKHLFTNSVFRGDVWYQTRSASRGRAGWPVTEGQPVTEGCQGLEWDVRVVLPPTEEALTRRKQDQDEWDTTRRVLDLSGDNLVRNIFARLELVFRYQGRPTATDPKWNRSRTECYRDTSTSFACGTTTSRRSTPKSRRSCGPSASP